MLKKTIVKGLIFLCRIFSNNEKKIVYHSFPDFSDNSFATFIYATKHFKDYKNVWLVDNYASKEKYIKLTLNYTKTPNLLIVNKKSFLGLFHYFTASIVFHTHGLYNFLGLIPNQKKINLWHGMPIKNIGYLDNPNSKNVQVSNYHSATSAFYQEVLSRAFGVTQKEILITGQTRNDFLFKNEFSIHKLFNDKSSYSKTILWMPTFRKSVVGDIRVDGEINNDKDFFKESSLIKINNLLENNNSICYVKLHPMDYRKVNSFKTYTNIRFIDNYSFIENGINMYYIFNSIDILLTDFSSIYIDFLLLNRQIGFVFSDYEAFKNSRGFLFSDPIKYMPGEIITTLKKLELFLNDVISSDKDNYVYERKKIRKKFHKYDNDFSKILFDKLMIKSVS